MGKTHGKELMRYAQCAAIYICIHIYVENKELLDYITLEAEGMVLREISVMLEKEEGMRSLMGRFAKFTTLRPNLLPIFYCFSFLSFFCCLCDFFRGKKMILCEVTLQKP